MSSYEIEQLELAPMRGVTFASIPESSSLGIETDREVKPSQKSSLQKSNQEPGGLDPYRVTCHTYVLLLEVNWINMEKRTFSIRCEIGFMYDCHEFLRTFDYLIPLPKDHGYKTNTSMEDSRGTRLGYVTPDQMTIQFDIPNAISMDKRTEAHYIRMHDGPPESFYSQTDDSHRSDYVSDEQGLVSCISVDIPKNKFWKQETRTYIMELSLSTNQSLAPFDELYLFFKLINCNCQPGASHVYWKLIKEECSYDGLKKPVGGYLPVMDDKNEVDVTINQKHKMDISAQQWDRIYFSVKYRKKHVQDLLMYYFIPFMTFAYVPIRNFESSDNLLVVSSTLVIANVTLLIVTKHKVFSFSEMAVLVQIMMLIVATLILAADERNFESDEMTSTQLILLILDTSVFLLVTCGQYIIAKKMNEKISKAVKNGDFNAIDCV